jgi:hypothetical protein
MTSLLSWPSFGAAEYRRFVPEFAHKTSIATLQHKRGP